MTECTNPVERLTAAQLDHRRNTAPARAGKIMYVYRGGYSHVGVYLSAGKVVHFGGEPGRPRDMDKATVRCTTIEEFLLGGDPVRRNPVPRLNPHLSAILALLHVGHGVGEYHPLTANCEHFATFCTTGLWRSDQLSDVLEEVESAVADTGDRISGIVAALAARGFQWLEKRDDAELAAAAEPKRRASRQLYYLGDLWQGWFGNLHTRVQVRPWKGGASAWDSAVQRSPGAWIPGVPNLARNLPARKLLAAVQAQSAWTPLALGLGSLDEEHQASVREVVPHLRGSFTDWWRDQQVGGPVGVWRNNPDTPLGKWGQLFELAETTLTMVGQWWVDDRLELFLRQKSDSWGTAGRLDPFGVPGAALSPLLGLRYKV